MAVAKVGSCMADAPSLDELDHYSHTQGAAVEVDCNNSDS